MTARRIKVGCEFSYVAAVDTPVVFQVRPGESPQVAIEAEWWSADPAMAIHGYADLYGNPCARAVLPAGRSSFGYHAVTRVPDEADPADPGAPELDPGELPDDVLVYTLPSRYCLPGALGDEAWSRFGGLPRGYGRVRAVCDYVHKHLASRQDGRAAGPAADVSARGRGMCRDYAHLAISFCRALSIPARYVLGYLPDLDVPPDPAPMDFAAWMEAWLGDRWWTFDPRSNALRKGRVVIGRGRDASDVAMATTFGGPLLESMVVEAEEVG
jgi:transglutaminase-like putative cysteine protease